MKVTLIIFCCVLLWCTTGCGRNTETREKVRLHSQQVVENLYSDSIHVYLNPIYSHLPGEQSPKNAAETMLTRFRKHCPKGMVQSEYKGYKYRWNLGKDDGISFHYVYKCSDERIEVQVHYFITADTFRIAGLKIIYPDAHEFANKK